MYAPWVPRVLEALDASDLLFQTAKLFVQLLNVRAFGSVPVAKAACLMRRLQLRGQMIVRVVAELLNGLRVIQ